MNETDNLLEPTNHVSFLESTKKKHIMIRKQMKLSLKIVYSVHTRF